MARHRLEVTRHHRIATMFATIGALVAGLTVFAGPASAAGEIMGAHAFTLTSSGLLNIKPTTEVNVVAETGPSLQSKCAVPLKVGTLAAVTGICADAVTVTAPAANVAAGASVANVNLSVPGLPAIVLRSVSAGSGTSCGGSNGTSEIGFLKIGTKVVIGNLVKPAPNTKIQVGTIKVILNEQVVLPNGLLVDAVHISAGALLNVVVASAETNITCVRNDT